MEAEVETEYSILDRLVSEKYDVQTGNGSIDFRYEKLPLLVDHPTYFRIQSEDGDLSRSHTASIENPAYIEMSEVISQNPHVDASEVESWVPEDIEMAPMDYWTEQGNRPDESQERIDTAVDQAEEIFDIPVFMSRELYAMAHSRDDRGSLYGRPIYMSGIREDEEGNDVHVMEGRPYGDSRDIDDRFTELLEFSGIDVPELRETIERESGREQVI